MPAGHAMHITLERAHLIKPLDAISRVVERRNTIPILSNMLLRAEAGRLSISGTDLDMVATASVAAEITTPGAVTVPAQTLKDIVRKLPDGCQVELKALADGPMTIRAGRSRFTLQVLPASDWPEVVEADGAQNFSVTAVEVEQMLDGVQFAISTEETRYYLNGAYLHALEGGEPILRAVATDGHRMATRDIGDLPVAFAIPGVIVPRKAVAEIFKMAEAMPASEMDFAVSKTRLTVTSGGMRLTTKLIDGTFPDYNRVIPVGNPNKATLFRESLMQAVERVATVIEGNTRAIRFRFADGAVTVSATSPDCGDAEEAVDCTLEGDPVEIGFNGRYVIQMLEKVKADRIEIQLADGGAPALMRGLSAESEGHTLVLMPMRV